MSSSASTSSGGIGFFGLLGILFIGLKLTGHVTWSWWWVTAPLWGPAVFALGLAAVFLVVYLVAAAFGLKTTRRVRRRW